MLYSRLSHIVLNLIYYLAVYLLPVMYLYTGAGVYGSVPADIPAPGAHFTNMV